MLQVTVIVPVLDEQETIAACLTQFSGVAGVEVLVVDGGSGDHTCERVYAIGVGRLLVSPKRSRAAQMNLGASAARSPILLFLHADTRLPERWLDDVRNSIASGAAGGRFRLALNESTIVFRLIGALSTWRSRVLGITYGDQAIYASAQAFVTVGGFPDHPIFEDSEFSSALSGVGRFDLLDSSVETSTRRWREGGVLRTVLQMWALRFLRAISVSDAQLKRLYRDVR